MPASRRSGFFIAVPTGQAGRCPASSALSAAGLDRVARVAHIDIILEV